ncbi:hypothetical protein C5F48_14390 [Cereibacter changlensis JA139]|uniref:Peroxiredoxin n=2 Tax=Cereibacter changlensis TaxID=402884 RepID=A0A2T4JTE3_9RHOB|nr:hypothetical protein [Cereibacter changlensis]PTE21043.1 hypothetical protein C5F48_14390 [Cereibacter changlensis JA139]PZX48262.1 hypothetical protein LX76_04352 [Cereibacter changlensis]
MNSIIKTGLIAAAIAMPAHAEPNPKLLTIVTSADPQIQLMAMVLTANAVAKGAEARVLLCGPAGDMALEDGPESVWAPQPPMKASSQGMLLNLMARSAVKVQVCAIYLPGKGSDASVLLQGVTAAAPDAMAAEIVDSRTTVLTF